MRFAGFFESNLLAFDDATNRLYLYESHSDEISIIDTISNKKIDTMNIEIRSPYAFFIYAQNSLHLIGGSKHNTHLIYDVDKQKFNKHWTFKEWNCNYWGGLIHIKSKQEMLLFG